MLGSSSRAVPASPSSNSTNQGTHDPVGRLGHVFVVHASITHLVCDSIAVSAMGWLQKTKWFRKAKSTQWSNVGKAGLQLLDVVPGPGTEPIPHTYMLARAEKVCENGVAV